MSATHVPTAEPEASPVTTPDERFCLGLRAVMPGVPHDVRFHDDGLVPPACSSNERDEIVRRLRPGRPQRTIVPFRRDPSFTAVEIA